MKPNKPYIVSENEVSIFFGECTQILSEISDSILSKSEQFRISRISNTENQRQFKAGRLLLRTVLSKLLPQVSAKEWVIENNFAGRPHLVGPSLPEPFYFNLSHSRDYIVCAFSKHESVGIDVEHSDRQGDYEKIARKKFSNHEYQVLTANEALDLSPTFLCIWTLKEAFSKAMGQGIGKLLQKISFQISSGRTINEMSVVAEFDPLLHEMPTNWTFKCLTEVPNCYVGLAVKIPDALISVQPFTFGTD